MNIKLPPNIARQITTLVKNGAFASTQIAVEDLLSKAIRRRSSLSSGRFLYKDPIFTPKEWALEEWKLIPGFSKYEISNLGRVRSLRFGSKYIKLSCQTNGYRQAPIISDAGKQEFPLVQRLVASAFLPSVPGKSDANHKNGNKADNRASNIEWLSPKENSQHAVESGLRHWRGTHHRAKITEKDVVLIRQADAGAIKTLSDKYGLSVVQIRNIQKRKSWAHVK